ncbi:MAG TPA: ribbon-helix-helix domain-containing protein [Gemmataceae bacterium]|nr:ribbon-helix-helix domain-containing protein [Gemmataceae bacterium]
MPSPRHDDTSKQQRVIFSLPPDLVDDIKRYASKLRGGNKSGFVADALRSYIDQLHKARHTAKLREAYAASAEAGLAITREWEPLDAEAWARLDKEKPHRKGH